MVNRAPPLYYLANCTLGPFLHGEFGARILSVAAGSLLPVVLYLWLRGRVGVVAACVASMLAALSPNLVDLTAEVRSYALTFLLASLVLLFLDEGIDKLSETRLALAGVALTLSLLTDYSFAILAPATARYGFARLRESGASRRLWFLWVGGLVLTLVASFALYWFHIRAVEITPAGMSQTYLRDAFRAPGQSLIAFLSAGIAKQFFYVAGSQLAGLLLGALFLLSLPKASLAWRILLITPFATGLAFALLKLFPFGETRHSAVVSIVIAAGLGLAAQQRIGARSRIWPIAISLILILLFFVAKGNKSHFLPIYTHRRAIRQAPEFLAHVIDSGRPILATGQARLVVSVYRAMQGQPRLPIEVPGPWGIEADQVEPVFAGFRRRHSIARTDPVIFVEGGFGPYEFPDPKPNTPLRSFASIRVWEIREYGQSAYTAAKR